MQLRIDMQYQNATNLGTACTRRKPRRQQRDGHLTDQTHNINNTHLRLSVCYG